MAISKFFRSFVEGETISDGRKITAAMIDEVVATFNADTYSPRINIEHIAGFSPEPPFNGYGTVVAVKAQTDDITIDGKTEKRRALYTQVDANPQLVALAKADQKPFPSVELTPSYAGCGKIGLVGLAFTDTPASVGTQKLQFSRSAPGTLFAGGTEPVAIEFEAAPVDLTDTTKADGAIAGFFNALAAQFKGGKPAPKPPEEPKPAANDNDLGAFATALGETVSKAIAAAVGPVVAAQTAMQSEFATIKTKLEGTPAPDQFSRAPHSGGSIDAKFATDC